MEKLDVKKILCAVSERCFIPVWGVMLIIAPLCVQMNLGGRGLELPFNIPVWFFAVLVVSLGGLKTLKSSVFVAHRRWYVLLLFPLFIIVMWAIRGVDDQFSCVFRLLFIMIGVLFLFSLFQFRLTEKNLNKALFAVVIAGLIQAVIAVIQIYTPGLINYFLPTNGNIALGTFQQINVLAIFLVSSVIAGVFLTTRPFMGRFSLLRWTPVFLCLASSSFVAAYTGSRIAMLSLAIALPILVITRIRYVRKNRAAVIAGVLLVVACSLVGGGVSDQRGFARVVHSSEGVQDDIRSSKRVNMYLTAFELIAKRPFIGHGLGGFQKQWNLQTGDYMQRYPAAEIDGNITHPHNEVVLWAIEMGMFVVVIAIIVFGVVIIQIKNCGFQRGGAYLALLMPISLHAMVELPFFLSSLHWFLWLFFLFLPLRHGCKNHVVRLSQVARKCIYALIVIIPMFTAYFLIDTSRAQADIYRFVKNEPSDTPPLKIALNNFYSYPYAEELAMRTRLYNGIKAKDRDVVDGFVFWAEGKQDKIPQLKIFEDLINAYIFLKDQEQLCETLKMSVYMYPSNQVLHENLKDRCGDKGDSQINSLEY